MSNFMFCYDINYGDIMFCEYNFWKLCLEIVSTGIIVNNIRSLSTRIIVDLYIPW